MHGDQVVEGAEQDQVGQLGFAALGLRPDVVDLAGGGWGVAAGEGAVLVAGHDGAAQEGVIMLAGVPASSGRLTRGELVAGEAGAQERGQPVRAGQDGGGVPQQGVVQPGQHGWMQRRLRVARRTGVTAMAVGCVPAGPAALSADQIAVLAVGPAAMPALDLSAVLAAAVRPGRHRRSCPGARPGVRRPARPARPGPWPVTIGVMAASQA